jgi:hypothetical protein
MTTTEMENIIRSALKESTEDRISQAEIITTINTGYKEVASLAFCYEQQDNVVTVIGDRMIPFSGCRVNQVEYDGEGLLKIRPQMVGSLSSGAPKYWFSWGQYVVIDPVPDQVYALTLYIADYPSAQLTEANPLVNYVVYVETHPVSYIDADVEWIRESAVSAELLIPAIPEEFHFCIVDFTCYALSLKLRKWEQAGKFYNAYIRNVSFRKKEYINRKAERRAVHYGEQR